MMSLTDVLLLLDGHGIFWLPSVSLRHVLTMGCHKQKRVK